MQQAIGFEFTSGMHDWLRVADVKGPCCIVDNWTYGRIEVTPAVREYRENGVVKSFVALDWKTV